MKAEEGCLDVPPSDVGVPFIFERHHTLQPLFHVAGFSEVMVHRKVRNAVLLESDRLQTRLQAKA